MTRLPLAGTYDCPEGFLGGVLKVLMVASASASTLLFISFLTSWGLYAVTSNEAWISVGIWGQLLAGGTAGYSLWAYSYGPDTSKKTKRLAKGVR